MPASVPHPRYSPPRLKQPHKPAASRKVRPTTLRAVIGQVDVPGNPKVCAVFIENRLPLRQGFTLPQGCGAILVAGTTKYSGHPFTGPYYNNPLTQSGGSWVTVDLNTMSVTAILNGVATAVPSEAGQLIASHVHSGGVDPNGNPMPSAVDLTQHTAGNFPLTDFYSVYESAATSATAGYWVCPGDGAWEKTGLQPNLASGPIVLDVTGYLQSGVTNSFGFYINTGDNTPATGPTSQGYRVLMLSGGSIQISKMTAGVWSVLTTFAGLADPTVAVDHNLKLVITGTGPITFSLVYDGSAVQQYTDNSGVYYTTGFFGLTSVGNFYIRDIEVSQSQADANLNTVVQNRGAVGIVNVSCAGQMPYVDLTNILHFPSNVLFYRPNGDYCRISSGTTIPVSALQTVYINWVSQSTSVTVGAITTSDPNYPKTLVDPSKEIIGFINSDSGRNIFAAWWINGQHFSSVQNVIDINGYLLTNLFPSGAFNLVPDGVPYAGWGVLSVGGQIVNDKQYAPIPGYGNWTWQTWYGVQTAPADGWGPAFVDSSGNSFALFLKGTTVYLLVNNISVASAAVNPTTDGNPHQVIFGLQQPLSSASTIIRAVALVDQVVVLDTQWNSGLLPPVLNAASANNFGGSLPGNTKYYYVITAFNVNGETLASNEINVTTPVAINSASVNLSWTALAGATGYKIYRSQTVGTEALIATVGQVVGYRDINPAAGTTSPPSSNGAVGISFQWACGFYADQPNEVFIRDFMAALPAGVTTVGLIGQGSFPPQTASVVVSQVGSWPAAGTPTIKVSWTSGVVYFSDGSQMAVAAGSQTFTGLVGNANYFTSAYVTYAGQTITVIPPIQGPTAQAVNGIQPQLDGRVFLVINQHCATPATAGSPNTGSTGGGGHETCPAASQLIETLEHGFIYARDLKPGMHLRDNDIDPNTGDSYWNEVYSVTIKQSEIWRMVTQEESLDVDRDHRWYTIDGRWVRAYHIQPGEGLMPDARFADRYPGGILVKYSGFDRWDDFCLIDCDRHRFVLGQVVGHNGTVTN